MQETDPLQKKIAEFAQAMQRYHARFFYRTFSLFASCFIVPAQLLTLCSLIMRPSPACLWGLLPYFLIIYLAADFINGLIHLYMDNNTDYCSPLGPFVAAFHLHHRQPRYRDLHPLKVYFYESGGKFWLIPYLSVVLYCQWFQHLSFYADFFLTLFGILSSLAEVSHYWCHNAGEGQTVIRTLQKIRILLPEKHHAKHHVDDNTHYAFLNGVTDPLINFIAGKLCAGYRHHADLHALAYMDRQTRNR